MIKFKDPANTKDIELFKKCGYSCGHPEHFKNGEFQYSFCTQGVLHPKLSNGIDRIPNGIGYISKEGHHFTCNHPNVKSYHTYFMLDMSSSMGYSDKTPFHTEIKKTQNNRFGCALQALNDYINNRCLVSTVDKITLILFNEECYIEDCDLMNFQETSKKIQLKYTPEKGTNFDVALKKLDEILASDSSEHFPMLIFLSDGCDGGTPGIIKYFFGLESPSYQTMTSIAQKQAIKKDKKLEVHMVHFAKGGYGGVVLENLVKICKSNGLPDAVFHNTDSFGNLQTLFMSLQSDFTITNFY